MLINKDDLDDIGLVIFDEFHERNLYSDFALAVLLEMQEILYPHLKILLLSATLNSENIIKKLAEQNVKNIPIIECQ